MTCKAPLISELKARRQSLGLPIKDVGERCGIDERFLCDWERGEGTPRLDAIERWAAALGLKLALTPREQDARPGLRVDWERHCITVDGTPVRLTPMEWKALERLAAAPGQLVSHQALFQYLYGADQPYRAQSTAIRVLITKLRRLLPLRIEAQWGRGYVISGVEPSRPQVPKAAERNSECAPAVIPERIQEKDDAATRRRQNLTLVPKSIAMNPPSMRAQIVPMNSPPARRTAVPQSHPGSCRAEELGVIERFLAERGVTRCPDMATIQHAPLPTLIWDKDKRKWVRPAAPAQQQAG